MPTINNLPPELIVSVTDNLGITDIAALVLTNRALSAVCDRILYHRTTKSHDLRGLPVGWGAWLGHIGTVRKALAAGSDPNHVFYSTRPHPRLPFKHRPSYIVASTRARALALHRAATREPRDEDDEDDDYSETESDYYDESDDVDDEFIYREDEYYREICGGSEFGGPYRWKRLMEYTGIHCAASQGHLEIVEMLLDHGAEINSEARNYCSCNKLLGSQLEAFYNKALRGVVGSTSQTLATPLHSATCNRQFAIAKLLLKRDANPLTPGDHGGLDGSSAIFLAARCGLVELLKFMLEINNDIEIPSLKDASGLTALYHACAGQCWHTTVPFLLNHGLNIDQRIAFEHESFQVNATMLGEACYTGKFQTALRLLDLGADIAVGVAVTLHANGDFENRYVRHQDQSGDRPSDRPHEPLPLLHACCHEPERMGDPMLPIVIKRLVKLGASLEGKWGGETALGFATRRCVEPAVRALLDAGADVDSPDTTGKTPLMAAIFEKVHEQRYRDDGVAAFQRRHPGIFPEEPGRRPLLPVVKILLNAKASLTMRDLEGRTALHHFFPEPRGLTRLAEGNGDIVRLLLRNGADPCARDGQNMSVFVAAFNAFHCSLLSLCNTMLRTHYRMIIQSLTPCELRTMIKTAIAMGEEQVSGTQIASINFTLDLDHTRSISSDKRFFLDLFRTPAGKALHKNPFSTLSFADMISQVSFSREFRTNMVAANAIFQRGVEDMGLDTEDWTIILCGLLFNRGRDTTYDFILAAIRCADLNHFDQNGRTLLYQLLDTPYKLSTFGDAWDPDYSFPGIACAALLVDLVNSGANAHLSHQRGPAKMFSVIKYRVETPVQLAIEKAIIADPNQQLDHLQILECLLQQQPIHENPEAIRAQYLHQAVARIYYTAFEPIAPVVQVLLDAGADPTELNEYDDTPLSVLMQAMIEKRAHDPETLEHVITLDFCRAAKMLSQDPAVDINRKNKEGSSVVDYLQALMSKAIITILKRLDGDGAIYNEETGLLEIKCPKSEEWVTEEVDDDVMHAISSYLELVDVPGQGGRKMIKWLQ